MLNTFKLSLIFLILTSNVYADLSTDAMDALINKNYIVAVPLLKNLAEQGDPNAHYNLAILYKRGLGVVADAVVSNAYFSKAAHRGLVDGYQKLSVRSIKPAKFTARLPEVTTLGPEEWVKAQSDNYFTLQLASSTNAELIKKYFTENSLDGKGGYYKNKRGGEYWYALVYGAFPSVSEANAAVADLPEDLKKWSPWVRKLKSIHRLMSP